MAKKKEGGHLSILIEGQSLKVKDYKSLMSKLKAICKEYNLKLDENIIQFKY